MKQQRKQKWYAKIFLQPTLNNAWVQKLLDTLNNRVLLRSECSLSVFGTSAQIFPIMHARESASSAIGG